MMTRADYDVIARALRGMPTHAPSLRAAKRSAVLTLADALQADNGRFKRVWFLEACGEAPELDLHAAERGDWT